jgi:hypothetical protein
MAEGQRGRNIGSGIKPLGNERVKPQKETKKMTEQSTNEGQQKSILEPVLSGQEGNKTPGNLDPGIWALQDIPARFESIEFVALLRPS